MILCRSSGAYVGQYFGYGTGIIWLSYLHCLGTETSFVNCTSNDWAVHHCFHNEDVSIVCGDGTFHWSVFFTQLVDMILNVMM